MRLIQKSLMVLGDFLFTSSDFTYTGTYTWVNDGFINGKSYYRIKFLTSGTFTPKKLIKVDVFLVGGGGGGRNGIANNNPGGGGAGGRTGTWLSATLAANVAYTITVAAGGSGNGGTGGTTSISGAGFTTLSVTGGTPNADFSKGGHGGSGGGTTGGSDGSNGSGTGGGTGQGTTTREFAEAGATLYAGGGGGGGFNGNGGAGGAGGGGAGGWASYSSDANPGTAGTTNLGGGGGGGGASTTKGGAGAAGGSGICIIRNKRT